MGEIIPLPPPLYNFWRKLPPLIPHITLKEIIVICLLNWLFFDHKHVLNPLISYTQKKYYSGHRKVSKAEIFWFQNDGRAYKKPDHTL